MRMVVRFDEESLVGRAGAAHRIFRPSSQKLFGLAAPASFSAADDDHEELF